MAGRASSRSRTSWWQVAATGVFGVFGAFDGWAGYLGLVIAGASWAGLVGLAVVGHRAGSVVAEALAEASGPALGHGRAAHARVGTAGGA